MVKDGVDIRQDTVLSRNLDGADELLLGTPVGSSSTLLLKLSQVPEIVCLRGSRLMGFSAPTGMGQGHENETNVVASTVDRRSLGGRRQPSYRRRAEDCQIDTGWEMPKGVAGRTSGDSHLAQPLALLLKLLPVNSSSLSVPLEVLERAKHRCQLGRLARPGWCRHAPGSW